MVYKFQHFLSADGKTPAFYYFRRHRFAEFRVNVHEKESVLKHFSNFHQESCTRSLCCDAFPARHIPVECHMKIMFQPVAQIGMKDCGGYTKEGPFP